MSRDPIPKMLKNFLLASLFLPRLVHSALAVDPKLLSDALGVIDPQTKQSISEVLLPDNVKAAKPAALACRISELVLNSTTAVILPGSYDYQNETQTNWSDNCWQNASCYALPSSAHDVSRLLIIVNALATPFSVRSGGHDFNVNHSSVASNGLVIDTQCLNHIQLTSDKSSVSIGVGARWGDVYQALNGSSVSVNGARSPNPGVGGQTLGAGIGWLSSISGVSAASVIAADIVLANGTELHANKTINSDLLWAIKGGGPNFGVITTWYYRTLPIDKVWYEARQYTPDKNEQLVSALAEYQKLAENDSNASIVYSLGESSTQTLSFVGLVYLKPEEYPAAFRPFYGIQASSVRVKSRFGTLADLAFSFNSPQYPEVPASRDYVVSLPHQASNATYHDSYAAFRKLALEAMTFDGVLIYGSQPFATRAIAMSADTPLGLENTVQDWIHVTLSWSNSCVDAQAQQLVQRIGDLIQSAAMHNGDDLAFRFMNDAYDGQNVLASYGQSSLQRLTAISRKYDPQQVFQRLQNSGWLLSRV